MNLLNLRKVSTATLELVIEATLELERRERLATAKRARDRSRRSREFGRIEEYDRMLDAAMLDAAMQETPTGRAPASANGEASL